MTKYRISLGFQLAVLTALCVLGIVAFWGGVSYVLLRVHQESELVRRVQRYGGELSSLAGRSLTAGRGREDRALKMFLQHVTDERGMVYAVVLGPSKKTALVKPETGGVPGAGSRSLQFPVRTTNGVVKGWVQIWYSAEGLLADTLKTGKNALLLTALLSALILGGAVYGICWFLIFRPIRLLTEKRWGKLFSDRPAKWQNELGLLLQRFGQVSDRLEESEENLAVLLEASRAIASPMDIQEILTRVFDLVWQRVGRAPCLLWRQDEDGYWRIKSFRNFPPELAGRVRLADRQGNVGLCFAEQKTRIADSLSDEKELLGSETVRSLEVRSAAHFPLVLPGIPNSVLTVFSRTAGFFNPERCRMIETLMGYLSLAAKSAHFYSEMQDFNRRLETEVTATARELTRTNVRLIRRVRELRSLYDVVSLAPKLEWNQLAAKAVDHVVDLFNLQGAAVYLWDEREGLFRSNDSPFVSQGKGVHSLVSDKLSSRRSLLAQGGSVVVDSPEEVRGIFPEAPSLGALVLSPLQAGDELLGFLAAAARPMATFDEEDVTVLTLFSRHLSEVLSSGRFRAEREQRIRDLTTLQEVSLVLSSEPDLATTLARTAEAVARSLGADVCAFMLYDEGSHQLVAQGSFGLPPEAEDDQYKVREDDPKSSSGRVFLSGEPFISDDAQNDQRVPNPYHVRLWNIRSFLVAPLRVENRPIGVLRVGHKMPRYFNQDHLRLAMLIADRVAVIVQNARLYAKIQEQVELLERQNREKTEFISLVSHELRSPLTAIKGFINVILGKEIGGLSEKQERFLVLTRQAVDRLTILTNDLLDMSRLEVGRMQIEATALSVEGVLDESYRQYLPSAKQKNISLTMESDEKLPKVNADPNRIRQVIDNLIVNALKFTPDGGKISLFARLEEPWIRVGVRDNGIGLPPEEAHRIFEKFYQVRDAVSPERHGAGLGLAICKSLVELHGGRIWVESTRGEGSVFQFTLPVVGSGKRTISEGALAGGKSSS